MALWRRLVLDEGMPEPRSHVSGDRAYWWRQGDPGQYFELARKYGAAPSKGGYSPPNYSFAAGVLMERARLLGPDHPYLKEWVANQDIVFASMDNGGASVEMLRVQGRYDGLAESLAADDLAYQKAAFFYYARNYDQTINAFRAIARTSSRYRAIAAYMVAKTLMLSGQSRVAFDEIDAILADPDFAEVHISAQQLFGFRLWRIPESKEADAESIRLEAQRRAMIFDSWVLSQPKIVVDGDPQLSDAFADSLYNLAFYLHSDRSRYSWLRPEHEDYGLDPNVSGALAQAAQASEMLDWLQTGMIAVGLTSGRWTGYLSDRVQRENFKKVDAHIAARIASGHSLPWTLLQISRATARMKDPEVEDILARVETCDADIVQQVAAGPLRFHVRRLAFLSKNWRTDWPGKWPGNWWWQDWRGQRISELPPLELRRQFYGFFDDPGNPVIALATVDELAASTSWYDRPSDAVILLNLLPLEVLASLTQAKLIPIELRAAIARVTWTRAYLTQRDEILRRLTPVLAELNPELAPLVEDIDRAWTENSRKRAQLRLLLRTPAMNVRFPAGRELSWHTRRDPFRSEAGSLTVTDGTNPNDSNWWCRFDPQREMALLKQYAFDLPMGLRTNTRHSRFDRSYQFAPLLSFSNLVRATFDDTWEELASGHPLFRLIDWQELGDLSTIEAAPTYLGKQAIAWARDASWFDRWWEGDDIAEALALTVRATRWGCTRDGSDAALSREAYLLLHQLFPDSAAAARTRYWYD